MKNHPYIEHDGKIFVSQEQYSRHRGVSRRTVYRYLKEGKIDRALHHVGGRAFINIEIADLELGHVDPAKKIQGDVQKANVPGIDTPAETMPPASSAYQTHRASREAYSSKLEKIKYEEKAGLLVNRRQVELEAEALARLVRDAILNVPSRIAAQVAAETDRVKCELFIEKELRLALEELANTNMEVLNVDPDDQSGQLRETTQSDASSGQ